MRITGFRRHLLPASPDLPPVANVSPLKWGCLINFSGFHHSGGSLTSTVSHDSLGSWIDNGEQEEIRGKKIPELSKR